MGLEYLSYLLYQCIQVNIVQASHGWFGVGPPEAKHTNTLLNSFHPVTKSRSSLWVRDAVDRTEQHNIYYEIILATRNNQKIQRSLKIPWQSISTLVSPTTPTNDSSSAGQPTCPSLTAHSPAASLAAVSLDRQTDTGMFFTSTG